MTHAHDELEDHDLGLSHDLPQIVERNRLSSRLGRRGLLSILGGVGVVAVAEGVPVTVRLKVYDLTGTDVRP